MRHIAEIDSRAWDKIQQLLREGRYESVAQFIAVAIQNQIQLEMTPLDKTGIEAPSSEPLGSGPQAAKLVSANSLEVPIEEPILLPTREEASNEVIWGLYNRIFPVKITLRVLAQLLVGKSSRSVELKLLREESALQARSLGKQLLLADKVRGSARGERFATGLPIRRGDKSLDRFKNMFVGTMSNHGKVDGFPTTLRFIMLQRRNERVEASLTTAGFKFAALKSPILDGELEGAESTLSIAESEFYMTHVHQFLPREWDLCHGIIEGIPDGNDTPAAVDQVITRMVPSLNPSMVAPTRAGMISRLDELGLVQRRHDGLRVSYALTDRGESFLKSAQGVTTGN